MKNNMLVLLNCPEDIESHLQEIREIAQKYEIGHISLARITFPFGTRVRNIVAPHKLEMAARMSDESVSRYLSRISLTLEVRDINVESVANGIPATDINRFIEKHNFHLIVKIGESPVLSHWSAKSLVGIHTIPVKNI